MLTHGVFSARRRDVRPLLLDYTLAAVAVGIAILIRWLFDPLLGEDLPFAGFLLAVLYASMRGGIGPGLSAILLSALAARYFFIDPRMAFSVVRPEDFFSWSTFLIVSVIITVMSQAQRDTTEDAEARAEQMAEDYARLQKEVQAKERAQRALTAIEQRFQMLANMAPVLIWMTDTTGATVYLNRRWLEFTGRTFEQEKGQGWLDSVHPEDIERCLDTFMRAFKEREEFRIEYRHLAADGRYEWLLNHGIPRYDPDGCFQGYIGSCVSITDRKREELRNALLLKFMTSLSRAVTPEEVADVIVEEGTVALGGSLGMVAMLDAKGENLVTLNRRRMDDQVGELRQSTAVAIQTPLKDVVKSGKPLWIDTPEELRASYPALKLEPEVKSLACLPLRTGGRVIGAVMVGFPYPLRLTVRERSLVLATAYQCAQAMERARLFEAEAAARKDAEIANEMKVRFLGMISHDLRAPLHLIMGFAEVLANEGTTWSEEKQKEIYEIVSSESHKLYDLVDQLLDASQIQAGTLRIRLEDYPLSGVVEMARPQMEKFTDQHQLVIDVPIDLPLVRLDPARMSQVLVNLVSNAAKYSSPGTEIHIKAARDGDFVRVDVSDEGDGIPSENREMIFEAFTRMERDYKKKVKGIGLGLSIVKGLVEAHGGRVWVQDHSGPGAVMSFTVQVSMHT